MALLISRDDRKPTRLACTGSSQLAAGHRARLSAGPLATPGTNPNRLLVRVHSEAHKLKPLLNDALIGTLYRDRHTDLCSGGAKQCREKGRRSVRGSALWFAKR